MPIRRTMRAARAMALALLLVALPYSDGAGAGQALVATDALPLSAAPRAQELAQCCRVCRKGQPCGDGCISVEKQCKKDRGCACSAASGS